MPSEKVAVLACCVCFDDRRLGLRPSSKMPLPLLPFASANAPAVGERAPLYVGVAARRAMFALWRGEPSSMPDMAEDGR